MIFLYTDFGREGPYMGQMEAVLRRGCDVPVVTLLADAPAFDIRGNAYLLAAYTRDVQAGDVTLCIVDPGVGMERHALVMRADGRWFVGPDNGLMSIVARRARQSAFWRITWRPETLSASFHGRDLFAPIAALLAKSGIDAAADKLSSADMSERPPWPDQYAAIVTFDRYGNAITGLEAAAVNPRALITCAGHLISSAATFGAVPEGQAFWYGNSSGLVEIAVNQGSAQQLFNLQAGMGLRIEPKTAP